MTAWATPGRRLDFTDKGKARAACPHNQGHAMVIHWFLLSLISEHISQHQQLRKKGELCQIFLLSISQMSSDLCHKGTFQVSLSNGLRGVYCWQRTGAHHFFQVQYVKALPWNVNEVKANWFHFWSIQKNLKLHKLLSNINWRLSSMNMLE
jgi:hypothetical protein